MPLVAPPPIGPGRFRPSAILIPIATATASGLMLKYLPTPWIWTSLLMVALALRGVAVSAGDVPRAIWFNVGFLFLLLGIAEVYSWGSTNAIWGPSTHIEYSDRYYTEHDVLGYGPLPGQKVTATMTHRAGILYQVTYTIDGAGLRISPSYGTERSRCAIFFGGSFTFGEGVNDEEAMPYLVGENSDLRSYNFGFHGYGPHQMLAALQEGIVQETIEGCEPAAIVYQAIFDHVLRAAGKRSWGRAGPRYALLPDGNVVRNGRFADGDPAERDAYPRFWGKVVNQVHKSTTYERYEGLIGDRHLADPLADEQDVELFLSIVAAAKAHTVDHWPRSSFHVIFWDGDAQNDDNVALIDGLKRRGLEVHVASDVLPDYGAIGGPYRISVDGHPNPAAHRAFAGYVIRNILGESEQGQASSDRSPDLALDAATAF